MEAQYGNKEHRNRVRKKQGKEAEASIVTIMDI